VTIRNAKQSRAAKAKGRSFENEVVQLFKDAGFEKAERRRLAGSQDRGDITGIDGLMVEAKAVRQITLAAFMDEVKTQTEGGELGVAFIKRRGRGAHDAYVVMSGCDFTALFAALSSKEREKDGFL